MIKAPNLTFEVTGFRIFTKGLLGSGVQRLRVWSLGFGVCGLGARVEAYGLKGLKGLLEFGIEAFRAFSVDLVGFYGAAVPRSSRA